MRHIIAPFFLALAVGLISACEPLEVESCAISCIARCPNDMLCREGRCVTPGFTESCEPEGASDPEAPSGGAGGQPPLPEAAAGSGAVPSALDGGEAGSSSGMLAVPAPMPPVLPPGSGSCASNGLEIQPCPLPAPCLGEAYDVQLTVTGGTAPHVWTASTSQGLSISTSGRVTGVPQASGALAAHVSDAAGLGADQTLSFEPRRSCWFAYVGSEGATRGVELFDPILSSGLPKAALTLPRDLPEGDRAIDFQFSPDGRFLAIRAQAPGGGTRLELFEAPAWQEREFLSSAPGAIQGYAWSPDSASLAMTTRQGASDFLTGFRVSSAEQGSTLTPLPVVSFPVPVESAPLWFGTERVVFVGPWPEAGPDISRLYHSRLTVGGFEPIATRIGSYARPNLRLTPSGEGFFALVEFMDLAAVVDFIYPIPGDLDFTPHAADVALAPSSGHVARVVPPSQLELMRGAEDQLSDDGLRLRPLAVAEGCDFLLAWSSQSQRLACVTSNQPSGSLRIFDFDASAGTLRSAGVVEGTYTYDEITASFRRRAFSPTGRWFSFSTGRELFVAEVSRERYLVDGPARFTAPGSDFAELSFSPDERLLLQHQGSGLWLHTLGSASEPVTVSLVMPPTPQCSEVGSARNWCGTTGASAALTWSEDSKAAAYRTATTTDVVLSRSDAGAPLMIGCGAAVSAYAFQP